MTTWGSGIEQIVDGFHKFTIRPMLVSIEQAIRKSVMTASERASMTVEFSFDALLRASLKDRMDIYAKATQNGIKSRNECRQLENDPPYAGGDVFTAHGEEVQIQIAGQGSLPAGFELARVHSGISGLGLVRALLPRRSSTFKLEQLGREVVATLALRPPSVRFAEPGDRRQSAP